MYYKLILSLTLLVSLCLPSAIIAQQKNFSITATPSWLAPYQPDLEKKPDAREISNGYYLLLHEEQNHVGKAAVYRHIIRQIVSEAGIQNGAEISVDYDPAYQKLYFHQVLIRRKGEVINQLQPARFKFLQQEQDLSRFIYSGMYTAYFLLEDVRKDDQIEYSYTLEGYNPVFDRKYAHTFYFSSYDPIVNFYKNLILPPGRDVHFKAFNYAQLPDKKDWNGMQLYEWNITAQKPAENVNVYNTPSWYTDYPFVQASEYKQWQEVIDWGTRINTPPAPGPALRAKIAEFKKAAAGSKEMYLQMAIRFVQDDIRYMGIEMGEYSHRPNTPDKILSQRFGDCKDKSLLLTTLLKADSIPASMVYVNTYHKGHVSDFLPSPDVFNHVIVFAGCGGKGHWIDPTISYQRGTIWSLTIPDYQKGLIISPGGDGDFTNIYQTNKGKITIKESFTLPADKKEKGTLSVLSTYTLQFADDQRSTMANSSLKDEERAYRNYYKKQYGSLTTDTSLQIKDVDSHNMLEIKEQYHLLEPWKKDTANKQRLTFSLRAGILSDILPVYTNEEKKSAPLYLRYPYSLDYTIDIELPIEWVFNDPPLHIRNKYYRVDFTPVLKGKHLRLHYIYETYQDHIPAEYLDTYVSDRSKIDNTVYFDLSWTPGTSPAAATSGGSINWTMVSLAFFFASLFAYMAYLFYQQSVLPVKYPLYPWPVKGWLLLLGLIITISPIFIFAIIVKMQMFDNTAWQQLKQAGGNTFLLQSICIFEMLGNIFILVYSILLVFLFYRKRDTFPKTMIYFYLIDLTFLVVDAVAVQLIYQQDSWDATTTLNVQRALVSGVVWSLYLLRSERVKETFIMPHHSEIS